MLESTLESALGSAEKAPDPKLFKLMAECVQDYAIFLLDPNGLVMSWNLGARLIKQYTAEEIIGRHFSTFYTSEDLARNWPDHELLRARETGRFEDEGWRIRKDGTRFWANVIITALHDESNKLQAYSKITRDLTERKRQDEMLRQSEERFRLLVDGVQDYAIYLLDPDGIVTSWNLGARRIKGYESTEIIGSHFSRFYSLDDIAKGKPGDELAIALEHGRAEDEGWRIRKDGTRFWARVVVTSLYDSNSKLRGFAKVTQDLTQRRHSENLADSAKNIHEFIAVLAHELRNPLAPIRNAVHVLQMAKDSGPVSQKIVQIIDRQSNQLSRIVDDILDVSRLTRGTMTIAKQPIPLTDIITRAVEAARPGIEAAHHTLELDVANIPLIVDADEVRIAQALTNLLNNAARYTDEGGRISLSVSVGQTNAHRVALISVRDNGRGIQPQFLNAIFGMFVQGQDRSAKAGAGLGVGLALARSIIELHHGTLEARSRGVGHGSEFVIELPLVAAPAAANEVSSAPVTNNERRVLIVDDNVDAATVIAYFLEQHGHIVHIVHNGEDALRINEMMHPDLILLDIGMPGMDGLEVARRIRQQKSPHHPFIVALTGWGKPEDEARTRDAGFDMHFLKPIEEAQLLSLLEIKRSA
ncbi:MAG: PAS domain S-box protein [Pseudomonadota bacterium]